MNKKVIGIYLAAGRSTRFNGNKLAASIHGRSLGSIALTESVHSLLDHIIVVINEHDSVDWLSYIKSQHYANRVSFTICSDANDGQAHSLQQGVYKANSLDDKAAIMVLLADQPFISRELLNTMITVYKQKEDYICIGLKHTNISPPLIISPVLFEEIFQLSGDMGARKMIKKYYEHCCFLPVKNRNVFIDIDTREDLNKWLDLF